MATLHAPFADVATAHVPTTAGVRQVLSVAVPVGAILSMGLSLGLAVDLWRRTGRQLGAAPIFVVGSVLLVDLGFLLNHLARGAPEWAVPGVVATSLGTMLAALGARLAVPSTSRPVRPSRRPPPADAWRRDVTVAMVVLAVSALYFVLLGYVPLVATVRQIIAGGYVPGLLNTLRTTRDVHIAGDASGGVPLSGLFDIIRYFAVPAVLLTFVQRYRPRSPGARPASAIIVASGCLVVATGQRWPLLYTIVGAAVLYLQGRSLRPPAVVVRRVLVPGAVAVVVISALLGRGLRESRGVLGDLGHGAVDLVDRAILGGVEVPFQSYLVLGREPLLLGATWAQSLGAYYPGQGASFPVTFYRLVTGDTIGYTAPPDFYTEAFLNFGIAGVAVLSFLWGVALRHIDVRCAVGQDHDELGNASRAVLLTSFGLSFSSGIVFPLGAALVAVGLALLGSTHSDLLRSRARL